MYDDDEKEEWQNNYASQGGGLLGLIVLIAIGWWAYNHFFKSYDKPWWNGTEYQKVCVVHNPNNTNCYNLPVTAEGGEVTRLGLPNGNSTLIGTMDCGEAVTFEGRYCVIVDITGRDWQVQSN